MRARQPRPAAQEISDETLMARYVAGDGVAFDELFRRFERRAFAYLAKHTRSSDRAQDLYQELFLRIHRARHAYDPRLPFAAWLFQIAHRLLIDEERRASRRKEVSLEVSYSGPPFVVESDEIADREQLSRLLADLSDCERRIVTATKLEGVGYAEIAAQQGKTVAAVKQAASRALRRIRCTALAEAAAGSHDC